MSLQTTVIYGSNRRDRRGIRVVRFIINELEARGHRVELVDSMEHELPLLDRMYNEYDEGEAPGAMARVAELLVGADGFVVVSGEYNHSIPPALKNLLDHYQSEYHYKPSALVTYSKGPFAGVRGLVNLRGIMGELGTVTIPSAFPVSKVDNAFDEDGTPKDDAYSERVDKFLTEYEWYARALKAARTAGGCDDSGPVQQAMCRN